MISNFLFWKELDFLVLFFRLQLGFTTGSCRTSRNFNLQLTIAPPCSEFAAAMFQILGDGWKIFGHGF